MTVVDLQQLIRCLDVEARMALEKAAALSVRHAHDTVELAHWLNAVAELPPVRGLLIDVGVPQERFISESARAVSEIPRGSGGTPAFSQSVIGLIQEAWLSASLQHGRRQVSIADLLLAVATDANLRSISRAISPSLASINRAALEARLAGVTDGPTETGTGARTSTASPGSGAGGEDFLSLYTQDMTADAAEGRIDPVIGREPELRQVIDILLRRRQNNPILVGEAGVGKTAVAEAFALRIHAGDVPEKLKGVRLLSLDLSLLQAGAGVKGEFERRLHGVVDAVKASPEPIILFIDEAHGLIGAGNQPGQGDAANILKPSLARGELRTIAATTWSEYKRHIERDAALTRRFQTVKVDEPNEETAVRMLRGIVTSLEKHHGVRIRDSALRAAVQLSSRYIPARQLPDKAISLIDTAASAVAFSRQAEPAALVDLRREAAMLDLERTRLSAEPGSDAADDRLAEIAGSIAGIEGELSVLGERLCEERELLAEADTLEDALTSGNSPEASDANGARTALVEAGTRLAKLQGEAALVHRVVDADAVAAVVARWTGVPVGRLVSDQVTTVNTLAERLKARVIGQDEAIDGLAAAMRVSRARLSDPRRPPGVFLMIGMSGVGKTETALALSDMLYGGPQHLTTINMSEFKEEHKVSMLVGSPPGYVGYGEGGVLTEAVRRRPYGVLLLDEMDKAHPGVQDIFYQLFDKGSLRDGEGRDIDFKNTTILMTANTGSEVIEALAADPDTMPRGEALVGVLKSALLQQFKPAFLGRTTVLAFRPLDRSALSGILDLQIAGIADRVQANYAATLTMTDAARERLLSAAELGDAGARAIETMIARDLLPVLSAHFLDAIIDGRSSRTVEVDVVDGLFHVAAQATPPGSAVPESAVIEPAAPTAVAPAKKIPPPSAKRKSAATRGRVAV